MTLDKIIDKFCKSVKRFYQAVGIVLALNAASIPVTYVINSSVNEEEQTIVFTSGHLTSKLIDFFMYTPITLRQNIRGRKVTWVSDAKKEEIIDYLQNPDYQKIVFIGHGTGSSFVAADGKFTARDISKHNIPKKGGELIQHTCGGGDQSLRHALLENPENYHGFDGPVRVGVNYTTAWVRLFD